MDELDLEVERKGIEDRLLSIEQDVRWLKESQEKQILSIGDVARLVGYSKQTLYTSRAYLLPLNHFEGITEWTRSEILTHLNRPIEEIQAEYEKYIEEHMEELTARGREKSKKATSRGKIKSAS